MNSMAFFNYLQNVPDWLPASTACPDTSDAYIRWHLRGKWGSVTLSGLLLIHISILCLIFYCNSLRIIPSLKLIYLLNMFLRWVCTPSSSFLDGELRPLKQEIYIKPSELVPSHSSFLMFLHLHGTTQKIPGIVKI